MGITPDKKFPTSGDRHSAPGTLSSIFIIILSRVWGICVDSSMIHSFDITIFFI
jgi:hypothetical protein